jgi:hypothetical protein
MPPLPPVTDPACLRVEFRIADDASIDAGSRFFLSYTGTAPSESDLNTLATAVATIWQTYLAGALASDESLRSVTITDLSSDTGNVGAWEGDFAGTAEHPSNPAGVCMVMNHSVSRRYRGGRPRTYLRTGTAQDLTGTNEWASAALTDTLAAWEAWIAGILATTGIGISLTNIVNVSYYEGFTVFTTPSGRVKNLPTLRTGGPHVDPVTSTTPAAKLGSQRRRLNL